MEMLIITDILFSLYVVNYCLNCLNYMFMLIHIGNLSKMCTLYCNVRTISYILYCSIISIRKGSASAYECHDSCISIIIYLQRYFETSSNHTYMSYNWDNYLMLYIFINTDIMQKMIKFKIIKNDGCK